MDSTTSISEALRQAADLLEQHPQLPKAYVTALTYSTGEVSVEVHWQLLIHDDLDVRGQKAAAAEIVRTLGGTWDKRDNGSSSMSYRQQHDPLTLSITVTREAVCERVVVGTETVTVPAVEAQPERTEEREVVRWECRPLLADEQEPAGAVSV